MINEDVLIEIQRKALRDAKRDIDALNNIEEEYNYREWEF